MGESKRKRKRFLEGKPFCILCGGATPSATEDHIPPKAIFKGKLWPEGYSFPACFLCNSGSKVDDLIIAFLSRMGQDTTKEEYENEVKRIVTGLKNNHLELLQEMFSVSIRDKRNFNKETGIKLIGDTYANIPLVNIPDRVKDAVEVFAAKVTKAVDTDRKVTQL